MVPHPLQTLPRRTEAPGQLVCDGNRWARGPTRSCVEDTGAGIPADLLPRIFELFVQGDTSLHRARAGLGIGLTLVQRLVDLHKGRIDVTSAGPGRGSAFTVRFPRSEPAASPPASKPAPTPTRAHRRILIIEDNSQQRVLAHPGRLAERGTLTATSRQLRRPDLPEGERRNKSQSPRPPHWCKFDPPGRPAPS